MKDILISQIAPVAVACLVAILVAIIKSVGDVVISYLEKQKEVLEHKLNLSKYQEQMNTAKDIYNIVEEKYRINEKVEGELINKADEFDKMLLEKIPYLTQTEVEQIRQAICGEINKGKNALNDSK